MGIAHDSGRSSDSKSVDDDILLTSYLIKMSLLDSSTIYTAPQLWGINRIHRIRYTLLDLLPGICRCSMHLK